MKKHRKITAFLLAVIFIISGSINALAEETDRNYYYSYPDEKHENDQEVIKLLLSDDFEEDETDKLIRVPNEYFYGGYATRQYIYLTYSIPKTVGCFDLMYRYMLDYENQGTYYLCFVDNIKEYRENYSKAYDRAIKEIECLLPENPTDFDIVHIVHDYLITTTAYDKVSSDRESSVSNFEAPRGHWYIYDASGCFVNHYSVCKGYSLSFKTIMDYYGIPCLTVSSENANHAWNIVELGGKWYHLDLTADDPSYDILGRVRHDYFLISTSTLLSRSALRSDFVVMGTVDGEFYTEHIYDSTFATEDYFSVSERSTWDRMYSSCYYYNGDIYTVLDNKLLKNGEVYFEPASTGWWPMGIAGNTYRVNDLTIRIAGMGTKNLYVSDNTNIYMLDLDEGTSKILYTPKKENNEQIYGLSIIEGKLYYTFYNLIPSANETWIEVPGYNKITKEIVGSGGNVDILKSHAYPGEKIVIYVTPEYNYSVTSVNLIANKTNTKLSPDENGKYSFIMPSADAKIEVTFTRSTDEDFDVSTSFTEENKDSNNGYITLSSSKAKIGDTVTVTGHPNDLYKLKSIKIKWYEGTVEKTKTIDAVDSSASFEMPGNSVTVSAVFNKNKSVFVFNVVNEKNHYGKDGYLELSGIEWNYGNVVVGEKITVIGHPNSGYRLKKIYAENYDYEVVFEIDATDNKAVFTILDTYSELLLYPVFEKDVTVNINDTAVSVDINTESGVNTGKINTTGFSSGSAPISLSDIASLISSQTLGAVKIISGTGSSSSVVSQNNSVAEITNDGKTWFKVEALGGQLRYDKKVGSGGTLGSFEETKQKSSAYDYADMRLRYEITLPEGIDISDTENVSWKWVLKYNGKEQTVNGLKYSLKEGTENTYLTNIVLTNIPIAGYKDMDISTFIDVKFTYNDVEYEIMQDTSLPLTRRIGMLINYYKTDDVYESLDTYAKYYVDKLHEITKDPEVLYE